MSNRIPFVEPRDNESWSNYDMRLTILNALAGRLETGIKHPNTDSPEYIISDVEEYINGVECFDYKDEDSYGNGTTEEAIRVSTSFGHSYLILVRKESF